MIKNKIELKRFGLKIRYKRIKEFFISSSMLYRIIKIRYYVRLIRRYISTKVSNGFERLGNVIKRIESKVLLFFGQMYLKSITFIRNNIFATIKKFSAKVKSKYDEFSKKRKEKKMDSSKTQESEEDPKDEVSVEKKD